MVKNILILTKFPLSKRDYDRFGIEILSRQFKVAVFDCTAWMLPEYWQKYAGVRFEFPGYISIKSWQEFEVQIAALENATVAIDYLFQGSLPQQVREALQKRNIPRTMIFSGELPPVRPQVLAGTVSFLRQCKYGALRMYYRLCMLFLPNQAPGHAADIAILTGEASEKEIKAQSPRKIWTHSLGYDVYLAHRGGQQTATVPYAVFLDQDLVHHPDLLYTGTKPATTEANYYPALNSFFDRFERLTGYRVVIAAHPRSRYDLRPTLFGRRETVLSKTAQLVRDSSLVFCHYSESVSFAVLWRKPVVFLTTDDLERIWLRPHIHFIAKHFGSRIINIDSFQDSEIDLQQWMQIDEKRYDRHQRIYIKRPGTPERPIWEIFSDQIGSGPSRAREQDGTSTAVRIT